MKPTYIDFMEMKDKVNNINANLESINRRAEAESSSSGSFWASVSPIKKFILFSVLTLVGGFISSCIIIIAAIAFKSDNEFLTSDKIMEIISWLRIIGIFLSILVVAILLIKRRQRRRKKEYNPELTKEMMESYLSQK